MARDRTHLGALVGAPRRRRDRIDRLHLGRNFLNRYSALERRAVHGEQYNDNIPDAFDIQERGRLAMNGLTAPTDPYADYKLYGWVDFFLNPLIMHYNYSDRGRVNLLEALRLLRTASGSNINTHVDKVCHTLLLKLLRTTATTVSVHYSLVVKGIALIDIKPPGQHYPLYER